MKQIYMISVAAVAVASVVGLAVASSAYAQVTVGGTSSVGGNANSGAVQFDGTKIKVLEGAEARRATIINQYGTEWQKAQLEKANAEEILKQVQAQVGTTGQQGSSQRPVQVEARLAEARQRVEAAKKLAEQKRSAAAENLSAKQKEVCEKHERQINAIATRASERHEALFAKLGTVADAVKSFYDSQESGKLNIDELLAQVEASEQVAREALDTVKQVPSFECDSAAPRSAIQEFRANKLVAVEELKLYRDSVKQLIDGVKLAQQGDSALGDATGQLTVRDGKVMIGGTSSIGGAN